ncbi:hypothetical protein [Staphylococcus chromogenes]|uniref:hypothetical protein n=1 Tax=Staphylococcus chromogenes TaxID=46126 RepID=UPI000D027002|nr:hypothetical protein [Staphylococcus chromogenes]
MNNISPVNAYTEKNTAISYQSYKIETSRLKGYSSFEEINDSVKYAKDKKHFPPNLEYVDSFLDRKTGMSGVAFKDTHTNKVTIGFAGTNVGSGNVSDMVKDVGADLNIGTSFVYANDPYYTETNKFINKIKKNYDIEGFTGHSKGGRDAMVLGIENNIDNIVVFNSASTDVKWMPVALEYQNRLPYGLMPPFDKFSCNFYEYVKFQNKVNAYQGDIIHFRNDNDIISGGLSFIGGSYYGKSIYFEGGGHSLDTMMSYDRQMEIKKVLNKEPFDKSLKSKHQKIQDAVQRRLSDVKTLRAKWVTANGGSLSSAQEKLLEYEKALALLEGLNQLLDAEIVLLTHEYQKAIDDFNLLWKDTIVEANDISKNRLSEGDIIEALSEGGASEQTIVFDNEEKIQEKIEKLKAVRQKYDDLIDKIKNAMSEIVQNDQTLAQQIGVMSS